MSNIYAVLVFALVEAAGITPVYVLEFCHSSGRDCRSLDKKASDTVQYRWNARIPNLIQELDQFAVSCNKLIGKPNSYLSIFKQI